MLSGIYCIKNKITGKRYIGQSERLEKREYEHFSLLEKGNHKNAHFQNSFRKYGKESFIFQILLYCEVFELTRYEQFFVDLYTPEKIYNIRIKCVDSNLGIKHSKKSIENMSNAKAGKNNPNYGKHPSKKTRKLISKRKSGHAVSDITRKLISDARIGKYTGKYSPVYGKHPSEKTRKLMSKNHANFSGENHPNAKLKEFEVNDILDLYYNKKYKKKEILDIYSNKISGSSINHILKGKSWLKVYNSFVEYKQETQ